MSEPAAMTEAEARAARDELEAGRLAHIRRAKELLARRDRLSAERAEVVEQLQALAASRDADLAAYRARRAELDAIIAAALEASPG